jgi:hypothetical protein
MTHLSALAVWINGMDRSCWEQKCDSRSLFQNQPMPPIAPLVLGVQQASLHTFGIGHNTSLVGISVMGCQNFCKGMKRPYQYVTKNLARNIITAVRPQMLETRGDPGGNNGLLH